MKLVRATWILPDASRAIRDGGLLVEAGVVRAWLENAQAVEECLERMDCELLDLGDGVLTPGLVNAHAHLELGGLRGKLSGSSGLMGWIGGVLEAKGHMGPADFESAVSLGAARLLETGTIAVGDIDSTGASLRQLGACALRARVYRELLDAHWSARLEEQLRSLGELGGGRVELSLGFSPHGPHTVSTTLLEACARRCAEEGWPVSIHWAESDEERHWMLDGSGPLEAILGPSPRVSGLQHLRNSGVLKGRSSLVHANHPEAGELEDAAQLDTVLVHCPGTHRFFDRAPLDWKSWMRSGVPVALGTDSLASNDDLDMRLEMSRLREDHPELPPGTVFDWATRGGALALGFEDRIGDLAVGKSADWAIFDPAGAQDLAELLDVLTAGCPQVRGVWIAGERV